MSGEAFRIHDTRVGPYPARVRIALAEKGLASKTIFVPVSLRRGEHKADAFRAKNYSGTLPVLELEDGSFIAECTAITEYLDALDGIPILTGRTPRAKGEIHMMTRRVELEVLDAISHYFHHATPGLGPDVELYQNHDWGLHQRDRALRGLRHLDAVLRERPCVAGSDFSMADIALVGAMIFFGIVKLPISAEHNALAAWYARMQARPSVRDWQTMSD